MFIQDITNEDPLSITKLEIVHYYSQWEDGIEKFQNIEALTLYWKLGVEIPKGLQNFKKLRYLYLDFDELPEFPTWLRQLPHLKTLILKGTYIKQLPDWIIEFKNLEEFRMEEGKLAEIHEGIGQLKKLKILGFPKNKLTAVPASIGALENLKELWLERNKIQALPTELFGLSNLEVLNVWRNKLPVWYPEYAQLTKLKDFYWEANDFDTQTATMLPTLFALKEHNPGVNKGADKKIGRLAESAKVVDPQGLYLNAFVDLYDNNTTNFEQIPLAALLKATQLKGTHLPDVALGILWQRAKDALAQYPLQKGSKVVMVGKSNFKKNELKENLEQLGLDYQSKLDGTSTHIVLGPSGKLDENWEQLLAQEAIFIAEEDIRDYINQNGENYLLEKDEAGANQNVEQLLALLQSENEDDLGVALELIKGGGMPPEAITDVFLVYKYKGNKKQKKKAKELLMLHGSPGLQDALKNKIRKLTGKTTNRLYEFTEGTELEQWKLNQYIYLNEDFIVSGQGRKIVEDGVDLAPEKEQMPFIHQVLDKWTSSYGDYSSFIWNGGQLDFAKYGHLVFEQTKIRSMFIYYVYWEKQPEAFPPGISKLENLRDLKLTLNLGNIGNVPAEIFDLKDLELLEMTECALTELSPRISEFKKLTKLDLSRNKLTALPETIKEMKGLKTLKLGRAFDESVHFDIDALRTAMPWCNISD